MRGDPLICNVIVDNTRLPFLCLPVHWELRCEIASPYQYTAPLSVYRKGRYHKREYVANCTSCEQIQLPLRCKQTNIKHRSQTFNSNN